METGEREVLLILAPEGAEEALTRLRGHVRIEHVLRPRVALARAPGGVDLQALQRLPGVAVAAGLPLPDAVWPGLTPTEQLFIKGWLQRQAPKTRTAEGLPWDAPGFKPPDKP